MFPLMIRPASGLPALALLATLALGTTSCASIEVTRTTQTSGHFVSKATSFMILWYDLPRDALDTARDNAADARLINARVTEAYETPHLGWLDWAYQFLGIRWATVRGTWGFTGKEEQ